MPERLPIDTTPPPEKNWYVFPDSLQNGQFRGCENRENESLSRGAFVLGQNVKFRKAGLPTLREGSESLGTMKSEVTPINRAWVFETRDGIKWEIRARDTFIECRIVDVNDSEWSTLLTGLTTDLDFGYGNIGVSTGDFHSYFCNGTDSWYRFNGKYGIVSSVTTNTIVLTDTIANRGLYTTGTRSVIINGTVFTYTGESSATLTGVTPDPAAAGIVAGDYAIQSPQVVSSLASYKGNVVTAHDGRLHVAIGSKWFYSMLDNPEGVTIAGNDGDANLQDIEFSGAVTAFGKLNKTILCFKKGIIKYLTFNQSGSRVDVPYMGTLIPADDKSTTLGAVNQKSTFATPYGLVFVTPDKKMILLTGITQNEQPEYLVLSDPIQPIFDRGDHSEASGICVDNTIRYSFKSSPEAMSNDTVIVGDLSRQSFDKLGKSLPIQWDVPVVGHNVNDWTAVEEDGSIQVHFHGSINANSWRIIENNKSDDSNTFVATIRTWAETFGVPYKRKKIDMAFIDIRMKESTSLLSTILYDENGITAIKEDTLLGMLTQHRFTQIIYNPFGANPFGSQKFGSNPENDELSVYRFYIEINPNIWFWNISWQLSSETAGNDFELVRFGYHLKEVENQPDRSLKLGYTIND